MLLTVITEDFMLSRNFISPSYLQRASKCLLDHQLAAETHFPAKKKKKLVVRVWTSLPPLLHLFSSFYPSISSWVQHHDWKWGLSRCVCSYLSWCSSSYQSYKRTIQDAQSTFFFSCDTSAQGIWMLRTEATLVLYFSSNLKSAQCVEVTGIIW